MTTNAECVQRFRESMGDRAQWPDGQRAAYDAGRTKRDPGRGLSLTEWKAYHIGAEDRRASEQSAIVMAASANDAELKRLRKELRKLIKEWRERYSDVPDLQLQDDAADGCATEVEYLLGDKP